MPVSSKRRLKAHQVTFFSLLAVGAAVLLFSLYPWDTLRTCESNIHLLKEAIEAYKADHGELPKNRRQLVPDYLPSLPTCPTLGLDTYRVAFGRRAGYGDPEDKEYYLIRCTAMEHYCPDGFPAYDTVYGMMYSSPIREASHHENP